jgi:hypothetical protein
MSGTCAPKPPAIEEPKPGTPSSDYGRKPPSVLGFSIVSALNVICLGFIAYHFASHPDEPAAASIKLPQAGDVADIEMPPRAKPIAAIARKPLGNVDFLPAQKRILSIASHIDGSDKVPATRRKRGELVIPGAATRSAAATSSNPKETPEHWVQLGALSEEIAARRYWSGLKARHEASLQGQEPHYFGPKDVGGGLFHIRLGPMASDAATALCKRLEAEGADCFCISLHD